MTVKDYVMLGLIGKLYPTCRLIDTERVKVIETEYGSFNYSPALQIYYNLFQEIEDYDFSDLSPEDVVLDLGACVGVSTVRMAVIAKKVIAVEPLFSKELEENVERNSLKNVSILPYALDDTFELNTLAFAGKTKIVQCASMKAILRNCPEKPTFLKTDCEGGEWCIQPGHLTGIRAVEAEIHNFGGHKPMNFVIMLQNMGFSVRYEKTSEGQLMIHARRQL